MNNNTSNSSPSRQQLHQLIDQMSDAHADAMLAFAHVLHMDPASRALLFAPYDDEPVSAEEDERVRKALVDPRPDVPFEEMKQELGL
jgi:hypothetical protein